MIKIDNFTVFFSILRRFVRLGEYDLSTTNDGQHEDIGIVNFEMAELDEAHIINDIAVLYLERHVEFTG